MKKSNLLIIPLICLAAFLGVMLSNTEMTEAANNETCSPETFRDDYIANIDVNYDNNNVTITNNSGLHLSYTFYADGDTENVAASGDFANGSSATVVVESGGFFLFTLQEDMEEPCIASVGNEVGTMEVSVDGLIDNPLYYDSVCVNYRNSWSGNQTMQNAVPYCFSAKTYESYSREEVQGWIDTAESLYEAISSSNGGNDITIDSSYQEVDDVKNTEKLVCDAFSTNNYETMHKYYHVETETANNCEVTCKEEIEVNFSDPVATQAGLCFQYLIEIKSKVVCDASYKAAPPTRKQACYRSPVCINGGRGFDAGGPSEEFDSCVLDCDGGEYTQSCIDSCYSEVYEKSSSSKKATKTSDNDVTTKEDIKELSGLYLAGDSFYEVTKLANSCPGTSNAQTLYNYMQNNPSGHYSGNKWISDYGSNSQSICALGPYYFRSLAQTRQTIGMYNGTYSYSSFNRYYRPHGNGILMAVHRDNTWCNDSCSWKGTCGSNTALTEAVAQKEYKEAVEEYKANKEACEQRAATCTNETTDYEIVVDNVDNDSDTDDDEETFSSSQKLNSTTVNGEFPDMVILTDGSCEDGQDDPWHYHNIITFPGTWVNNKTGQTVHSMEPGHEDFYTYVGNEYCTKLNSVPVNTAWYNWKVNQNGDTSILTDDIRQQIEDNTEMNINGHIENYGYFGWDFDVSCFYAIDEPETPDDCTPDDPDYPTCERDGCSVDDPNYPTCTPPGEGGDESPVNDYEFRSVSLDNLFPNSGVTNSSSDLKDITASNLINTVESMRNNDATLVAETTRDIGFNWTCAATNLENPDYIVQPVTVMNRIQALGDSIYDGEEYLDYHIRLTPETMNKVRAYNDKYDSYAQPTGDDSSEVLTAGTNKTSGITVYRSYLLHRVLNSNELLKSGLIGCNNEDNGTCNNTIDTSTSCYNEYMAQSAVLKGAN